MPLFRKKNCHDSITGTAQRDATRRRCESDTYKASTPAPDEDDQRQDEVDEEQRGGGQQDEVVVHSERQAPRHVEVSDASLINRLTTTITAVMRCLHLPYSRPSTRRHHYTGAAAGVG